MGRVKESCDEAAKRLAVLLGWVREHTPCYEITFLMTT
jgi:hypothetical protein